jgi:hypothetical protein
VVVDVDDVEHVPRGGDCRIVRRGLIIVLVIEYSSSSSSSLLLSGDLVVWRCNWDGRVVKVVGRWCYEEQRNLMVMMWSGREAKMARTFKSSAPQQFGPTAAAAVL